MINLLPQAYFAEVLQMLLGWLAFVLVAWMVYDTWFEREAQKAARHRDPHLPEDWWWWSLGNYRQEVWRLFETGILVCVGVWSVLTSTPDGRTYYYWFDYQHPVVFWELQQNVNVWRIVAIMITGAKAGAGLTARYYRQKAYECIKDRIHGH